jgi:type II secretory pathway pseudopilin PulG
MVVLIIVATAFVNSFLWARVAESDFSSAKQFMQTVGLQIDDVAWTVGRKATVRYSSTYGTVDFLPSALNYTVYAKTQGNATYQFFASYKVGVFLFNMPVSKYSLYDGYYELIYPASASNLTFTGTSAPVARVFGIEKLTPTMSDGSFVRVVVVPSVRSLFSNMTSTSGSTYYTRLYLPVLTQGSSHGSSQSVTLTGNSVTAKTKNQITSIRITVDFPSGTSQQGFDSAFFHFPTLTQVINVPLGYSDSVLELYAGVVNVELGVHS